MIADCDISFVVQGPIIVDAENSTKEVLNSIRKYFPKSEIILSTWEGQNTSDLEYDRVVFSKLPPALNLYQDHQCNVNRQIVSTINGIKVATKKYVAKTRTNTIFTGNGILDKYQELETKSVFEKKIFSIHLFTRDQYKSSIASFHDGFLHHPSDIFLFGLKYDLYELFSCPMATIEIMLNKGGLAILVPEQYIWMNLLLRKSKIKNYKNSIVKHNIISCYKSEKLLFDNFKMYDSHNLGLKLEDRLLKGWMYETVIHQDYQERLDKMSDFQKKSIYFAKAVFYCVINNRFWRKQLKSVKKRINLLKQYVKNKSNTI
jgi:hypothetical protein